MSVVQDESFQYFDETAPTGAFGSSVTSGNVICGMIRWVTGTVTLNGITDTRSTSYTIGTPFAAGTQKAAWFWGQLASGGANTLTFTFSANPSQVDVAFHEMNGVAAASPIEDAEGQYQSAPGSGTNAISSGTLTIATDGCQIVGFTFDLGYTVTIAAGTSFSLSLNDTTLHHWSESRTQATAANAAATFTGSGADISFAEFVTAGFALKPAASGSTISPAQGAQALAGTSLRLGFTVNMPDEV